MLGWGVSDIYITRNELQTAEANSQRAYQLALESGSGETMGIALGALARINYEKGNFDKAIELYNRSLPHQEKFKEGWLSFT